MEVSDFVRIVGCFAETPAQIDVSRGEFVVQLRDELISGRFERRAGSLYVNESDVSQLAENWIIHRVARLAQLADRILTHVSPVPHFVNPSAHLLPSLEADPTASETFTDDAFTSCKRLLSSRVPGTTSVIYLTSDAGEGKTTIINSLARDIAEQFKRRECDWVLLPVPLGGNSFLRFDEVVIGALMNRLRFQYWFFEGFIELVRLGVVVPAFDGFEEMIVEGSSGEAVSALGNLMNQLNSEGTVLFAARKAFFDYQSFRTQARLFDAIGNEDSVSFSRLSLERWSRAQFEQYGASRGHADAPHIFELIAAKFGEEHPLLTRAVLVRRLFDVAVTVGAVDQLIKHLGVRPQDYFHEFVLAIIEREAGEKWLDKEGREGGQSLLTVAEHVELLAAVAREMWISSSDVLRMDVVDIVSDLFCGEAKKPPAIARQVRERLKHHALLVSHGGGRSGLSFDHDDFKKFFTGVALGGVLASGGREDLRSFLRVASIEDETAEEAFLIFERSGGSGRELAAQVQDVIAGELPTSFVLENAGSLLLRAIDKSQDFSGHTISGIAFKANALRGRAISGIDFVGCYFSPTSLRNATLQRTRFVRCKFERIELSPDARVIESNLDDSEVACVADEEQDRVLFEPTAIHGMLENAGFVFAAGTAPECAVAEPDLELTITERVIRAFLRATQVNEATMRMRLGNHAGWFSDHVLPELIDGGVLEEVGYRGAGSGKRFRLAKPMKIIQGAIASSQGNFAKFLTEVGGPAI